MRDKKSLVSLLVVSILLVQVARGACPNKCGGHGRCIQNDVCDCMQNWSGGDCSLRVCPFTRAWHDTAVGTDDAHYYKECANRGVCDRDKGLCECDIGFAGSGCRRLACPDDCNGHGTCEFIEDLAGNGYDPRINGVFNRKYTLWDQEKIMGCRCDPGFEGHNCIKRMCPRGDDPLTAGQTEMMQAIVMSVATSVEGYLTYHDPYGMAWTTERILFDSANAATTCAAIQLALRRLPNNVLNSVTVTNAASVYPFVRDAPNLDTGVVWEVLTAGTALATPAANSPFAAVFTPKLICVVSFQPEPGTSGYQNLMRCNVASHADTQGQHPMTNAAATAASCFAMEVYPTSGTPAAGTAATRALSELAVCSNRGQCDPTTGSCKCYAGHMGLACQKQEALV